MASDADVDWSLSRKYINAHVQISNQLIFSGKRLSNGNFYQTTKHVFETFGGAITRLTPWLRHCFLTRKFDWCEKPPGEYPEDVQAYQWYSVTSTGVGRRETLAILGFWNLLLFAVNFLEKEFFFLVSMPVKWNFRTVGRLDKLLCQPSEKAHAWGTLDMSMGHT